MRRETITAIIRTLFHILTRVEIVGAENVPAQGPVIIATNHMSMLDTPLLLIAVPRSDLIALVADKYRFNPLFKFLVVQTGSIWIDRDKADFSAFRVAMQYLKKGGSLGIAPEGTRSRVGALLQGKSGTVFLAEKANTPIVPVAIAGSEVVVSKMVRLQRPPLRVRFGKPFTLSPVDRNDREASLQRNTDEIMCRIAALLPEKYHGFYAGHPRVKELLGEMEPEQSRY
jgi:1-acyl-sn-glycerol-3-phosphate acyltransferase